jgi:hypothetical protein
LFKDPVL